MITLYKDTLENFINCLTEKDILIELYNFTSQTFGSEVDVDGDYIADLLYKTNGNTLDRLIKIIATLVKQNIYDMQYKIHSELKSGQLLVNSTTLNELIDNIVDNYDYRYTLDNINIYEDSEMSYEGQYAKQKMLGDDNYSPNEGVLVTIEFNKYNDLMVNIYAKELLFPMIMENSGFSSDSLIQLDDYSNVEIENSLRYIDGDNFTYSDGEIHVFREGNEVDWISIEGKIIKQSEIVIGTIEEKVETLVKNQLHIDTAEKAEWFIRELINSVIRTVDDVQLVLNKMPNNNELMKQAIENQKKFIKKYLEHIMFDGADIDKVALRAGIKDKSLIKIALNIIDNKKDTKKRIVGFENFQAAPLRRINVVTGKSKRYGLFESNSKHYIEFPGLNEEVSSEAETSYVLTINIERVYPEALYESLVDVIDEVKKYDYNIAIILLDKEIIDKAALKKEVYKEYKEAQ